MKQVLTLAVVSVLGAATTVCAQDRAPAPSPYAGFEQRPIKALSAQQLADLRAGRGMSLALAAELNGYPDPVHVLELARELELTPDQRTRTEALFTAMKAEAIPIGERLIDEETALDRRFAAHSITPESLSADVAAIGATQAKLRAAHLKYHLSMLEILTAAQVQRYAHLRGYGGSDGSRPSHGGHPQH